MGPHHSTTSVNEYKVSNTLISCTLFCYRADKSNMGGKSATDIYSIILDTRYCGRGSFRKKNTNLSTTPRHIWARTPVPTRVVMLRVRRHLRRPLTTLPTKHQGPRDLP